MREEVVYFLYVGLRKRGEQKNAFNFWIMDLISLLTIRPNRHPFPHSPVSWFKIKMVPPFWFFHRSANERMYCWHFSATFWVKFSLNWKNYRKFIWFIPIEIADFSIRFLELLFGDPYDKTLTMYVELRNNQFFLIINIRYYFGNLCSWTKRDTLFFSETR